jgi:thiol-disulfide isomerase/thioredoxin
MTNMKSIIILSTLIMLIVSCTNQKEKNQVIVNGKDLSGKITEVKFDCIRDNPISDLGQQFIATVDSNSLFSIKIPIVQLATGRINAGGFYHEICILPGDDFFVVIDADTVKYTGKGAEKNNFLYKAERNGLWDGSFYAEINRGKLNLIEFLSAMDQFKEKRLNFIESYSGKNKLEREFLDYYRIQTQVIYETLIQKYPGRYAYSLQTPIDSIDLPKEYIKLKQFGSFVDDHKVISNDYIYMLSEFLYSKYPEVIQIDSTLQFMDALHTLLFDSLSGKTQEYVLAKWICSEFSNNKFDTLAYNKFQKIKKDQLSTNTVKQSFDKYKEKQALIGQPLHPEFTKTMLVDTSNTQLTFGKMMSKYRGKVVYLDIWSLNCGPCRGNMPYSEQLKKRLTGLPIEFVYISQDAPSEDVWKKIFDVSLTNQNQYRMVKYEWGSSEMLKFMEINWVPCYMIFDKQGNLIEFNADGPYDLRLEEKLKELAGK